ncbi:MAG: type II toxin-antitoxin system Phd/YefM family antitoxin [Burkholderiales bacterium]|nr:type II toxin-antitoxin system Phd/YefM family antitoxin [Burkholderiales bacterium]
MIREAPAMTVRQNLGELLNEVQYRGDTVVITKAGKAVAALVGMALFERIRLMRSEFYRLTDRLQRAYSEVGPAGAEIEIAEAIKATRRK